MHPSPAPSASGPLQLSRNASLDSAVLREAPAESALLMSQLIASQQRLVAGEGKAEASGSVPDMQQGAPSSGLMANLSDPGALASLLQKGICYMPKCLPLLSMVCLIKRETRQFQCGVMFPCQGAQPVLGCFCSYSMLYLLTVFCLLFRRQHSQHHGQQHELQQAAWAQQVHHQCHDHFRSEHHHWLQR